MWFKINFTFIVVPVENIYKIKNVFFINVLFYLKQLFEWFAKS